MDDTDLMSARRILRDDAWTRGEFQVCIIAIDRSHDAAARVPNRFFETDEDENDGGVDSLCAYSRCEFGFPCVIAVTHS